MRDIVVDDAFNHHKIVPIQRSKGHSVVAKVAYISGEQIRDDRTGKMHGRPESRGDVLHSEIVGPGWDKWTPQQLWSAAEKAETRGNACVGRETRLALPHELPPDRQKALVRGYALWLNQEYGVAVQTAIHAPSPKATGIQKRNVHTHIVESDREVSVGPDGQPVFGKKVAAMRFDKAAGADKTRGSIETEKRREEWARRVNAEMEKSGSVRRLDHRSHERRAAAGDGPELLGAVHKGTKIVGMEKRWKAAAKKAKAEGKPSPPMPRVLADHYAFEDARRALNANKKATWKSKTRIPDYGPTPTSKAKKQDKPFSTLESLLPETNSRAEQTQIEKQARDMDREIARKRREDQRAEDAKEREEEDRRRAMEAEENARLSHEQRQKREWDRFWEEEARKAKQHQRKQRQRTR
jgi:hypothetical protein